MSNESYGDFYDNGPGSENFKRQMARDTCDAAKWDAEHPTSHPLCTMCPVLEKKIELLKKRNKNLMLHFEDLKRKIKHLESKGV
jgi:hypothetical protein